MKIKSNLMFFVYLTMTFISIISIYFINTLSDVFALATIILSVILVMKNLNNTRSLIFYCVILYYNFTICTGEYLLHTSPVSWNALKNHNFDYYEFGVILLFLFTLFLLIFEIAYRVKKQEKHVMKITSKPLRSSVLFYFFYLLIIFVIIFGIDWTTNSSSYTVRISSIFEYGVILFLFLYLVRKDDSKIQPILVYLLAIVYISVDFYFGGRISSLQLIFILLLTYFQKYITPAKLIFISFPIIMIMVAVGISRSGEITSLSEIFSKILINDTSVYAYGSSTTHLYTSFNVDWNIRIQSFFYFLLSQFIQISEYGEFLANVTLLSNTFVRNIGGGLLFSFSYFWLGYFGLLIVPFFVVNLKNKLIYSSNYLHNLMSIYFCSVIVRGYLYTPSSLIKGTLIIVPLLYCFVCFSKKMLNRRVV